VWHKSAIFSCWTACVLPRSCRCCPLHATAACAAARSAPFPPSCVLQMHTSPCFALDSPRADDRCPVASHRVRVTLQLCSWVRRCVQFWRLCCCGFVSLLFSSFFVALLQHVPRTTHHDHRRVVIMGGYYSVEVPDARFEQNATDQCSRKRRSSAVRCGMPSRLTLSLHGPCLCLCDVVFLFLLPRLEF